MKKAAIFLLGVVLGIILTSGTGRQGSYEYSEADLYMARDCILELRTPTREDIKRYDLDRNGHIGATDLLMIKKILVEEEQG